MVLAVAVTFDFVFDYHNWVSMVDESRPRWSKPLLYVPIPKRGYLPPRFNPIKTKGDSRFGIYHGSESAVFPPFQSQNVGGRF